MFEIYKNWMEFFFFIVMVIGLLVALASPSAFISYVIIFLAGLVAGRLVYSIKHKIKLPYYMIIVGFVLGYLIGEYYGSRKIAIAVFLIGAVASYKLSDKGFLMR